MKTKILPINIQPKYELIMMTKKWVQKTATNYEIISADDLHIPQEFSAKLGINLKYIAFKIIRVNKIFSKFLTVIFLLMRNYVNIYILDRKNSSLKILIKLQWRLFTSRPLFVKYSCLVKKKMFPFTRVCINIYIHTSVFGTFIINIVKNACNA